uniref:GTP-binding protein REM 1-like n=1 Tax=Myxine glutinosa TaxID=7769 RepID=UPI00358F3786
MTSCDSEAAVGVLRRAASLSGPNRRRNQRHRLSEDDRRLRVVQSEEDLLGENVQIAANSDCHVSDTSDTSVPPQEVYRLILLGDPGVGKSSLASAFAPTAGSEGGEGEADREVYTRAMAVDGVDALVLVSVGRTQDTSLDGCCPPGDAFLLVYSVADRGSFDAASERRIHLRRARSTHQDPPVIFVGNKSDLVRCREVSEEEGKACAVVFGCKFIETSAPLQLHVADLFVGAVRQVRLHRVATGGTAGPPPVTGNRAGRRTVNRRESFSAKARRVLVGLAGGIAGADGQVDDFQAKSKSCHDLSVL